MADLEEKYRYFAMNEDWVNFTTIDDFVPRKELQDFINEGDETKIAKYYDLPLRQLTQIPVPHNRNISGVTIIKLIKSNLIKIEELPLVTDKNRSEIEVDQIAFCNVINACIDLSEELGFYVNDRNDPASYPPFLKTIIRNTASKGPKFWVEAQKSLAKDSLPVGIMDAVDDYIKTIFLPHYLQGKKNYNIDEVLVEFRPKAIEQFFKDAPIDAICKLSARWHQPGRAAQLSKVKTYSDSIWEPLFLENFPSYGEEGSKITITPLTTSAELTKEGKDLHHCVGGFTAQCFLGSSHIISLRDKSGKALSTLEFHLVQGPGEENNEEIVNIKGDKNYHLTVLQHYGMRNADPSPECKATAKLFLDDIRSGKIKVDLSSLEQQRNKREEFSKDPSKKATILIGYDPDDTTKDENGETPLEKATRVYREEGLDNGLKVKIHIKEVKAEEKEVKEEEKKKKEENKNINIPKLLTTNFDILTGKIHNIEETKQEEETKSDPALSSKKALLKIKDHIFEICSADQTNFSKNNVNITFEQNKLYIKILAEPLGDNSFSPSSKSLNNLTNILQHHAEQTINAQTSEKKKGAIIKLITFKIDAANLSEVNKILEAKAPLKAKEVKKATAKKLENTEKKDREII